MIAPLKGERVPIYGNNLKKSKFYSGKIKGCWKSGNAFYHSMQNIFSSSCLFKIKIYGTIILPVVLYGCETWSLKLREERRLRVSENSVLSVIFGPMKDEVKEEWVNYIMRNLAF
jgi:hypothetical protein